VDLWQNEEAGVVGDEAQASIPLGPGPTDPPVTVFEVICRSAEDQHLQPATGGVDSGLEHAFTGGFDPTEVMVFLQQRMEAVLIGRLNQRQDPDVIQ
jgi:hypothetical protein